MKFWEACSKKEKIERWENCLRVLQGLSPHERRKHWNMGLWGVKTECGTIACAAGHCGLDPWFRRRGLEMDFTPREDEPGEYRCSWTGGDDFTEEFFGYRGCLDIFWDGKRRSVDTVIKEVRAHIKALKKMDPRTMNKLTRQLQD